MKKLDLSDIDYELPAGQIAQSAAEPRDSSRLLLCDRRGGISDTHFSELISWLRPGDVLVVNETRVGRVRVLARRQTGGSCELLFLHPVESGESSGWWEALARPSRRIRMGEVLEVATTSGAHKCLPARPGSLEVGEDLGEGRRKVRALREPTQALIERVGHLPLPPYFTGSLRSDERYQTVFAVNDGSAAAPTAGLHFTRPLIDKVSALGVEVAQISLDVGIDTFRPVSERDPTRHRIHSERYSVPKSTAEAVTRARRDGRPVIAVGTTVVRALESAAERREGGAPTGRIVSGQGVADMLIFPPFNFVSDGLITNFHAPRSTLLLLLGAFFEDWRSAYSAALERGFRFLSFGDAMFVMPADRYCDPI